MNGEDPQQRFFRHCVHHPKIRSLAFRFTTWNSKLSQGLLKYSLFLLQVTSFSLAVTLDWCWFCEENVVLLGVGSMTTSEKLGGVVIKQQSTCKKARPPTMQTRQSQKNDGETKIKHSTLPSSLSSLMVSCVL